MLEFNKDDDRHLKALLLMNTVIYTVVRKIFHNHFPLSTLQSDLQNIKDELQKDKFFSKGDIENLYPYKESSTYDIPLMIKLILGYSRTQLLDSEKQDLIGIKNARNELVHQNGRLASDQFGNWSDALKLAYVEAKASCMISLRRDFSLSCGKAAERLAGRNLDEEFDEVINGYHLVKNPKSPGDFFFFLLLVVFCSFIQLFYKIYMKQ